MKWLIVICGLGVLVYALSHTSFRHSAATPSGFSSPLVEIGVVSMSLPNVKIPSDAKNLVVSWSIMHPTPTVSSQYSKRFTLSQPVGESDDFITLMIKPPSEKSSRDEMLILISRLRGEHDKHLLSEISLPINRLEVSTSGCSYWRRADGSAVMYFVKARNAILNETQVRSPNELKAVYPAAEGIWLEMHFE